MEALDIVAITRKVRPTAVIKLEIDKNSQAQEPATTNKRVARVYIELDHIQPTIWRRVEVPLSLSLEGLHAIIQAVMLFHGYHLYRFNVGGRRYAAPLPEWNLVRDTYAARNIRISKLIDRGITTFKYTYNLDADWQHTIIIEDILIAGPIVSYPRFLDGERRAPPEDVGGLSGFEKFLRVMAMPTHPQYDKMVDWCGDHFEPSNIYAGMIHQRIERLTCHGMR